MEKHFKLTEETIQWQGHTLHRIEATRDSCWAKAGELGGFVEREYNLQDEAWVAVYFALSLTAVGVLAEAPAWVLLAVAVNFLNAARMVSRIDWPES